MSIFLLFQTDNWKSRAHRVFFGAFDSRNKAIDFAKYHGLYCPFAKVLVDEIALNQFEEN